MLSNKLSIKIAAPFAVITLLFTFLYTFISINHEAKEVQAQNIHYADFLARNIAYNAEPGVLTDNHPALNSLIQVAIHEKNIIFVAILDKMGKKIVSSGIEELPSFILEKPIIVHSSIFNKHTAAGGISPETQQNIPQEDIIGTVRVAISSAGMYEGLAKQRNEAIFAVILCMIITVVVILFLITKITTPLKELISATGKIAQGDLDHRVNISARDEIGHLADSFNLMAEQLSVTMVSKDYFNNIIESMIDMLFVLDMTCTIKKMNRSAANALGYEPMEMDGVPVSKLFPVPESTQLRAWLSKACSNSEVVALTPFEETFLTKGGNRVQLLVTGSTLYNRRGGKDGIILLGHDITQRKITEQLMRESDERYDNIVRESPVIIYSITVGDSILRSINPAFETVTGWKAEEWIGKSIQELIHPDDIDRAAEIRKEICAGRKILQSELRIRKKSGDYAVGEFAISPRIVQGAVVEEFGFAKDITLRKQMEMEKDTLAMQLLHTEKLAAIGHMASGIMHEMNNPLGVIIGSSQLILKHSKEDDPFYLILKTIEREATRAKDFVRNLLGFSRAGKIEKELCCLNETISSALSLVEAQTNVSAMTLVKEFTEELPHMFINRNQIQQVIINLANNAIDAMPSGGTLTVRTTPFTRKKTSGATIQIEDTGCGIPKEIQAKVFEPFFTTKPVGKGTGLGLALVYEIVQKHHGTIELRSSPGTGTQFTITLPFSAQ
ncbi:MAG: PAS domain S-box protein [Elusimicrobiota bacterium]